jgi:linoleoyl-CoA desaturase
MAAPLRGEERVRRPKFVGSNSFQLELCRRLEEFFQHSGCQRRDCWQMYVKTAILLAAFTASYVLLVFAAQTSWQAVPLAVLLGLAIAAIGFNVQHDGGHQAYSAHAWINKLMAMTMDLIGGSSYVWHWKHNIFHHTYVNITDHDSDIDLGIFGRLSPHQRRYWFHRWQHLYLWPLYGLLTINWHLVDDFYNVITGRIGKLRFPRPRRWQLVLFLSGKALFFTLALAIPLLCHRVWVVFLFFGGVEVVLGMTISIVFQLAHAVEEADFPLPKPNSGRMENPWVVHQAQTTVDFSRRSRVMAWLLGGLNFQIEHHLFPRICHINYPEMAKLVEETCREFGVRYTEHASFWAGLASHFRWMRQMGATTSPHE